MDEEFIIQAMVSIGVLLLVVWLLNPFPVYSLHSNLMNFLLFLSSSVIGLTLLEFGMSEFKTRVSWESFSLFAGIIVIAAFAAYGIIGYGDSMGTYPYAFITSAFFFLPIVHSFITARF